MQWRKRGDEQWQSTWISLDGEGNNELVFIRGKHHNQFKCAGCGRSLSETQYVLYGPVPRKMESDKRYCLEHSPIAIEVQE